MAIVRKTINDILNYITHTPKSNTAEKVENLFKAVSFEDDDSLKVGMAVAKQERNRIIQCDFEADYEPNPTVHNASNGWEPMSIIIKNNDPQAVKVWFCGFATTTTAVWLSVGGSGGSFDFDLTLMEKKTDLSEVEYFVFKNSADNKLYKISAKDLLASLYPMKSNLTASRNPLSSDNAKYGYGSMSYWINKSESPNRVFLCTGADLQFATWVELTGSGSGESGLNTIVGTEYPSSPAEGTVFIKKKA